MLTELGQPPFYVSDRGMRGMIGFNRNFLHKAVYRDSVLLALTRIAGSPRLTLGKVGRQVAMPCRRAETA